MLHNILAHTFYSVSADYCELVFFIFIFGVPSGLFNSFEACFRQGRLPKNQKSVSYSNYICGLLLSKIETPESNIL